MEHTKQILTADIVNKKLRRMALQIIEQNYNEKQLILIGIKKNGTVIAEKICQFVKEVFSGEIIVLELTIDKKKPVAITLSGEMDFNDKTILRASQVEIKPFERELKVLLAEC